MKHLAGAGWLRRREPQPAVHTLSAGQAAKLAARLTPAVWRPHGPDAVVFGDVPVTGKAWVGHA